MKPEEPCILPTLETAWGVIDFNEEFPPVDDSTALALVTRIDTAIIVARGGMHELGEGGEP
jgi:hypothetical protein